MLSNLPWFCLHLGISSSRSDSSVRVGRVFKQRGTTFSSSPGRKIIQFFGMALVRFLLESQKHTIPNKHKRRGRRFKGSRSAQSIMVTHVDGDRGCTAFCDLQNHGSSFIHHEQCANAAIFHHTAALLVKLSVARLSQCNCIGSSGPIQITWMNEYNNSMVLVTCEQQTIVIFCGPRCISIVK